ncbi:hypothetical protein DHEL01_v200210 [Diaporthe helianthi]|uniref:Uncharacterized protein n=1 Tax=Diaporthe helianthi TaxID=158607 RepID=A0A2P5IFV0_DIAHE|nr:hypothetical protein DHEL01_v200210 [Diaporthe helianthi]
MDNTPQSTFSTPKRKRTDAAGDDAPSQINIHFSFDVTQDLLSDGGDSPRTKVAHRFRGLALADSGGGAAAADGPLHDTESEPGRQTKDGKSHEMEVDEDESKMRKRSKLTPPSTTSDGSPRLKHQALPPAQPQHQLSAKRDEIPETPAAQKIELQAVAGPELGTLSGDGHVFFKPSAPFGHPTAESASLSAAPTKAASSKPPKQSSAANNRPLESIKSKGRRRSGTPPLVASASKPAHADDHQPGDAAAVVIDPIRAALTWHEDEITIYDPDDEDDDGVGINGIGFKPTPAIAYARTMKRRQQLAEYKKREEREARARRSSRRRGSPERAPKLQRKESAGAESTRKVRFMDSESAKMITT